MKRFAIMILLILLVPGCVPPVEDSGDKELEHPSPAPAFDRAAVAENTANKALVQILFVGTMVFDREMNGEDLERILVYVPRAPGHDIFLKQGQKSGSSNIWDEILKNPGGESWSFDLGVGTKNLTAPKTAKDLKIPPSTKAEAQDSRWLLGSHEIDNTAQIQPLSASLAVVLDTGMFETCGLVDDGYGNACKVKVGSAPQKIVMAESMLLRQEIPRDAAVRILRPPHSAITIKPNPGSNVNGYDKVFDIAILNVPQKSKRVLSTPHSEYLKQMFKNPSGNWSPAVASDCRGIPRPACFDYFARFTPRYSGYNRPICPLIEDS